MSLSTGTKINFITDPELKLQAEKLFGQMGINMTTALNIFLKASVQAGGIPFKLMGDDTAYRERIRKALIEAQVEAASPDTKFLTEEEALGKLYEKYGV